MNEEAFTEEGVPKDWETTEPYGGCKCFFKVLGYLRAANKVSHDL